jgi:3-methyladenine DNA glycosylase AlkD
MISAGAALADLEALADPERAAGMAAYHKTERRCLGLQVPQIEALVADWRAGATVAQRVTLAGGLWDSGVFEARVAATKLLVQARLAPEDDAAVWAEFLRWLPEFDGWALADHACKVAERRLRAVPARLDAVAGWTLHETMWVRRAALVATLPWAKLTHPDPADLEARHRILGWAAGYVADRDWFIQKAVAWWLRTLSVHDPEAVRSFLAGPGAGLKPFARRDAARRLKN